MDSEKQTSRWGFLRSRRSRIILAICGVIAVLAIVIPPAAVITLRKKHSMGPKSKVVVPLYVYPASGAWAPLENEISTHPDVSFTVVVNPSSGPGPHALPDSNYTQAIPELNRYDNVRLLGYVATTYTKRNISLVRQDIETYSEWPTKSSNPDLAVQGIFFDETPQKYDANSLAYLQSLTATVMKMPGLGPDHFIVHNPGVVPDSRYLSSANSTVVFEGTYDSFMERHGAKLFNIPSSNRGQLCALIHSVPDSIRGSDLRGLVKRVRKVAEGIFITHLSTDYYAEFGTKWEEFVRLMAAG